MHTRGPWKSNQNCITSSDGRGVAILEPNPSADFWDYDTPPVNDGDEMMANAALISAAPELLAVCKLVLARAYETTGAGEMAVIKSQILDKIRAAIAKATGK